MSKEWHQDVVTVGGTLVAGKGIHCRHLGNEHGFKHISYGDVLRSEASRQGRDHERTTLLDISATIRRTRGLTGLAELALEQWDKDASDYPGGLAVDGPRAVGDAEGLQAVGGRLLFVEAPINLRYQWMLDRSRDAEAKLSFEEFQANDIREWEGDGTLNGPNLRVIKAMAEVVFDNIGTEDELVRSMDAHLWLVH
jgi:adenylate kinase family enzyme